MKKVHKTYKILKSLTHSTYASPKNISKYKEIMSKDLVKKIRKLFIRDISHERRFFFIKTIQKDEYNEKFISSSQKMNDTNNLKYSNGEIKTSEINNNINIPIISRKIFSKKFLLKILITVKLTQKEFKALKEINKDQNFNKKNNQKINFNNLKEIDREFLKRNIFNIFLFCEWFGGNYKKFDFNDLIDENVCFFKGEFAFKDKKNPKNIDTRGARVNQIINTSMNSQLRSQLQTGMARMLSFSSQNLNTFESNTLSTQPVNNVIENPTEKFDDFFFSFLCKYFNKNFLSSNFFNYILKLPNNRQRHHFMIIFKYLYELSKCLIIDGTKNSYDNESGRCDDIIRGLKRLKLFSQNLESKNMKLNLKNFTFKITAQKIKPQNFEPPKNYKFNFLISKKNPFKKNFICYSKSKNFICEICNKFCFPPMNDSFSLFDETNIEDYISEMKKSEIDAEIVYWMLKHKINIDFKIVLKLYLNDSEINKKNTKKILKSLIFFDYKTPKIKKHLLSILKPSQKTFSNINSQKFRTTKNIKKILRLFIFLPSLNKELELLISLFIFKNKDFISKDIYNSFMSEVVMKRVEGVSCVIRYIILEEYGLSTENLSESNFKNQNKDFDEKNKEIVKTSDGFFQIKRSKALMNSNFDQKSFEENKKNINIQEFVQNILTLFNPKSKSSFLRTYCSYIFTPFLFSIRYSEFDLSLFYPSIFCSVLISGNQESTSNHKNLKKNQELISDQKKISQKSVIKGSKSPLSKLPNAILEIFNKRSVEIFINLLIENCYENNILNFVFKGYKSKISNDVTGILFFLKEEFSGYLDRNLTTYIEFNGIQYPKNKYCPFKVLYFLLSLSSSDKSSYFILTYISFCNLPLSECFCISFESETCRENIKNCQTLICKNLLLNFEKSPSNYKIISFLSLKDILELKFEMENIYIFLLESDSPMGCYFAVKLLYELLNIKNNFNIKHLNNYKEIPFYKLWSFPTKFDEKTFSKDIFSNENQKDIICRKHSKQYENYMNYINTLCSLISSTLPRLQTSSKNKIYRNNFSEKSNHEKNFADFVLDFIRDSLLSYGDYFLEYKYFAIQELMKQLSDNFAINDEKKIINSENFEEDEIKELRPFLNTKFFVEVEGGICCFGCCENSFITNKDKNNENIIKKPNKLFENCIKHLKSSKSPQKTKSIFFDLVEYIYNNLYCLLSNHYKLNHKGLNTGLLFDLNIKKGFVILIIKRLLFLDQKSIYGSKDKNISKNKDILIPENCLEKIRKLFGRIIGKIECNEPFCIMNNCCKEFDIFNSNECNSNNKNFNENKINENDSVMSDSLFEIENEISEKISLDSENFKKLDFIDLFFHKHNIIIPLDLYMFLLEVNQKTSTQIIDPRILFLLSVKYKKFENSLYCLESIKINTKDKQKINKYIEVILKSFIHINYKILNRQEEIYFKDEDLKDFTVKLEYNKRSKKLLKNIKEDNDKNKVDIKILINEYMETVSKLRNWSFNIKNDKIREIKNLEYLIITNKKISATKLQILKFSSENSNSDNKNKSQLLLHFVKDCEIYLNSQDFDLIYDRLSFSEDKLTLLNLQKIFFKKVKIFERFLHCNTLKFWGKNSNLCNNSIKKNINYKEIDLNNKKILKFLRLEKIKTLLHSNKITEASKEIETGINKGEYEVFYYLSYIKNDIIGVLDKGMFLLENSEDFKKIKLNEKNDENSENIANLKKTNNLTTIFYKKCLIRKTIWKNEKISYTNALKKIGNNETLLYFQGKRFEEVDKDLISAYKCYKECLKYGKKYLVEIFPKILYLFCEFFESTQNNSNSLTSNSDTNLFNTEFTSNSINLSSTKSLMRDITIKDIKNFINVDDLVQFYNQLFSNINHTSEFAYSELSDLLYFIFDANPFICSYESLLKPIDRTFSNNSSQKIQRYNIFTKNLPINSLKIFKQVSNFTKKLYLLANLKTNSKLLKLSEKIPEIKFFENDIKIPINSNLETITFFKDNVTVFSSLQQPKRLDFYDNKGISHSVLCKYNDDLRKDQRIMSLFKLINNLIKKESNSNLNLNDLIIGKITTYEVYPFASKAGFFEFLKGLSGLKGLMSYNVTEIFLKYKSKGYVGEDFEKIKQKIKPRLKSWFFKNFQETNNFLESKKKFITSYSIMCAVGYIIGLGDRHLENITINKFTGKTVHVDLNMLFDEGKRSKIPERVPFRLTQNIIDSFGYLELNNYFKKSFEKILEILKKNKNSIFSNLLIFKYNNEKKTSWKFIEGEMMKRLNGEVSVDDLIKEATCNENLSKMWIGWCSYI